VRFSIAANVAADRFGPFRAPRGQESRSGEKEFLTFHNKARAKFA
jgi:hypothetical protein